MGRLQRSADVDKVLSILEDHFKTCIQARRWLMAPNPGLGDVSPYTAIMAGRMDSVADCIKRQIMPEGKVWPI